MSGQVTVAALFVATGGCYFGLPDVDPWDVKRNACNYAGPWPVVAHPPCSRWCRLAGLVEARWGHIRGDDGGCFASALANVRRVGGVLEHPAYSDAWTAFDLPAPPTGGGWVRGICGGWSCYVEQSRYGHVAKKATWLYAFGVEPPPYAVGLCQRPPGRRAGVVVRQPCEVGGASATRWQGARSGDAARLPRRPAQHRAQRPTHGGRMTPATTQSSRAAFAALPLEERLRRTCGGCGLPEVVDGRCRVCGCVKDAWTAADEEARAEDVGKVIP